jgi:hypothetical protein
LPRNDDADEHFGQPASVAARARIVMAFQTDQRGDHRKGLQKETRDRPAAAIARVSHHILENKLPRLRSRIHWIYGEKLQAGGKKVFAKGLFICQVSKKQRGTY